VRVIQIDAIDAQALERRLSSSADVLAAQPEPARNRPVWDGRMDELGSRHKTAVLTRVAPDGFPISARVPVTPRRETKRIRIGQMPEMMAAEPGRACVVAHEHHPDFKWQLNFQVRGDLVEDEPGWALAPDKVIGGFELPPGGFKRWRVNARKMMRMRKFGSRELARRRAAAG